MTAMPIHATVLPSAIKGQPNGAIPAHLLETVDGRTGYEYLLASLPARGMRAMHAAIYAKFGVHMDTVGRGRTLRTQWSSFCGPARRYEPCSQAVYNSTPSANRKSWPAADRAAFTKLTGLPVADSTYWRKILQPNGKYLATSAVPGTSPHGMNCADDMALPDDADADTYPEGIGERPDILEWMYVHEHEYGFAHSLLSEIWHVQWIVGDAVPAAVLAYEASLNPFPTIPQLPPGDDMAKQLKPNDGDSAVFIVNGLTATWANDPSAVDVGVFLGTVEATLNPVPRSVFKKMTLLGALPDYGADKPPRPTVASDFAKVVA